MLYVMPAEELMDVHSFRRLLEYSVVLCELYLYSSVIFLPQQSSAALYWGFSSHFNQTSCFCVFNHLIPASRSDPRYVTSLGQTILNLSRVIPDGLLVFFPSYTVLRSCRDDWQASGIWSKISVGKVGLEFQVTVQKKEGNQVLVLMEKFIDSVKNADFIKC